MVLSAYFILVSLLLSTSSQVTAHDPSATPPRTPVRSPTTVERRSSSSTSSRNVPPEGFYNPASNGGSVLTVVEGTVPPGQGEPLNVIISGKSDAAVLVDQAQNGGLQNYFESFGFGGECLGQHIGDDQQANLGDGNGLVNETSEMRWDYGDPQFGTCKETVQGGNHFRYWIQSGPSGNSGAVFMATSYELPLSLGHDIIKNGYNLGRDWLIGNITQSPIPTLNLTDSSTFSGTTSANNYTYQSTIQYVSGILSNTSYAVNHNWSVPIDGTNAVDGLVAVIEVKITEVPQGAKSSAILSPRPLIRHLALLTIVLTLLLS